MSDPLGNRLAPALGILMTWTRRLHLSGMGLTRRVRTLRLQAARVHVRFRRERAGFRLRLPQCLQLNQAGTRLHDGRLAPA